jgi:hypothetical protein
MNLVISKFIFKIDSSTAMVKYQNKPTFLKRKGPHIGLYVKIKKNKHKWVCLVNKSEQHLLSKMGVTTLKKYLQKKLNKTNSYDQASALHQQTQVLQTF